MSDSKLIPTLALALVVGASGAYAAWTTIDVTSTAEGSLWIESERRAGGGDDASVRAVGRVGSRVWIELLRSPQVLESVVVEHELHLRPLASQALSVRDAARVIGQRLVAAMDQEGHVLRIRLNGSDPDRVARVLNGIMQRHVSVAWEMKRSRLDQTLAILEEQLDTVEIVLVRAERELGDFRRSTIRIPSIRSRSLSVEPQEMSPRSPEEARLERRVRSAETLYNEIRGRVETARLAAASATPDVRVLQRASVPRRPTDDVRLPIAAMIFFGSLGAGAGVAFLLDHRSRRFLEEALPVLAVIAGTALGVIATRSLVSLAVSGTAPQATQPPGPSLAQILGPGVRSTYGSLSLSSRIIPVVGDEQVAAVGELLPIRPTVMVVDEAGNPVRGAQVRFDVVSGGGVTAPSRARTDAFGRAFALWRLGTGAEIHKLSASVPGLVSKVTFTATVEHGAR